MSRVATQVGQVLREVPPDIRLRAGQWSIDEDPAGNATGHVELLTDSKEQALYYQRTLANVVVELQHETIPLQISGDSLVLGSFRNM